MTTTIAIPTPQLPHPGPPAPNPNAIAAPPFSKPNTLYEASSKFAII